MSQHHLNNSTLKVNEIFHNAIGEAMRANSRMLTTEFVLFSLIESRDSIVLKVAGEMGLDPTAIKTNLVNALFEAIEKVQSQLDRESPIPSMPPDVERMFGTPDLAWLLERADLERKTFGDTYISTSTLFLGFFDPRLERTREILQKAGLSHEQARKALLTLRANQRITSRDAESHKSVLQEFTRDLTAAARRGDLDPVACRQSEIERVIQILSRRKKNNPVLIGEPGVGKTVIIEGLVQRIVNQDVPDYLLGKRVLSLEMADIVAGAKMHGEFEERLKSIKEEIIAQQGEVILFIDEIHTVVGAGRTGGALDASNILKSALAKGQLQCVGATTFKEYKNYIESDAALERRFQPVHVEEPTPENAKVMVASLIERYEKHHKIKYSDDAIDASVELSHRYIFSRSLPDKAIDLIDEAGALKRIKAVSVPAEIQKFELEKSKLEEIRSSAFNNQDFPRAAEIQVQILNLENKIQEMRKTWESSVKPEDKIVTADDIALLVSKSTGIPVHQLKAADLAKLATIEQELASRVIGQPEAISAVANALRRNRVGLRTRKAPIGSFLFLGPTGVGKTELAKALASYVLNDESRIIRFDMSEYMERHETAKLIGSPPGYIGYGEGGQLTERVKRQPYSVILFDEIEKAHPDIFNMFLQILDDGRMTDAEGQTINFENTLVIFTSNIGSENIVSNRRAVGLGSGQKTLTDEEVESMVMDELKKSFRPEFLNRLDEIIVFHKLTEKEIDQIFALNIAQLESRLSALGLKIEIDQAARDFLIIRGFDPIYGARPLRRLLEKELENLIAQEIVRVGKSANTGLVNGNLLTVTQNQTSTELVVIISSQ